MNLHSRNFKSISQILSSKSRAERNFTIFEKLGAEKIGALKSIENWKRMN